MKHLLLLLFISSFLIISCSQDGLLNNSLEEVNDEYFDTENPDLSSSMKNIQSEKPIKVFRSPVPIDIDGLENDWKRAPKHKMRVEIDLGFELDDQFDLSSYFKMLWDEDNLYVYAKVLDEDINVSAELDYEKDGFEIYIDGNNSKTPFDYGDNTDFFRYIPGETQALGAYGIIDASTFESVIYLTENGYNVETKIPFSSFPDFSAEDGHHFGVEFQVNDNDNNQRQQLVKWWSDNDFSFIDPSVFGTAVLFDETSK